MVTSKFFKRLLGGGVGALVIALPAWSFNLPGFVDVKWHAPRATAVKALSQRFKLADPPGTSEGDASFKGTFAGYEKCTVIASFGTAGFDGASIILPKIDRHAMWARFSFLAESLSEKYGKPTKVQFIGSGNKPLSLPGVAASQAGFDARSDLLVKKIVAGEGKVRYMWVSSDKVHNVMLTLDGPSEIAENQPFTYLIYQQADAVSGIYDALTTISEL